MSGAGFGGFLGDAQKHALCWSQSTSEPSRAQVLDLDSLGSVVQVHWGRQPIPHTSPPSPVPSSGRSGPLLLYEGFTDSVWLVFCGFAHSGCSLPLLLQLLCSLAFLVPPPPVCLRVLLQPSGLCVLLGLVLGWHPYTCSHLVTLKTAGGFAHQLRGFQRRKLELCVHMHPPVCLSVE